MATYTHTFRDGRKQDYDYKDIIDRAGQFYKNGSGSLDEVTRAGLEYIAQGNDQYARLAQIGLSHWNNPEAVKNAYYNYNAKNGIEETPPTSVPTTSGGATTGGDTGGGDGKGDSKDWRSIIESIYAAYGKKGESVKGKYETNLAAIDEQERYAIELAKQQRDEAVKRAYALNDQSQVTYGQNAERLAQMGLTNAGYGDYLTGVAYGNLVGGVERANVNADNAVRDAYYAAGQAKSQVYNAMHNELADAEKAYKDTLASIVTAVSSGEINEEQAKAIAEAYGIKEDEALSLIGDAANAYKDATGEPEDTPDVTDNSAIVDIDTNGATTETIESADSYISGGKTEEGQKIYFHNDIKLIESLGKGNDLTIDEIKTTLEHHLKTGRLSQVDHDNLLKYLEKKTTNGDISVEDTKNRLWDDILPHVVHAYGAADGGPLAKWIGGVAFIGNIINSINGKDAYATIGNNQYRVNIDDSAEIGTEQQTTFNAAAGDSNILKQGEDYFIKINDKWYKVKSTLTEEGFFDAVNNKISSDTLTTAPTHNQQDY